MLTVLGVIAYAVTGAASVTALIPAFVGVLILVAGLIARNEARRRTGIHIALAIAVLGALGSLMNVADIGSVFNGSAERPGAIIVSTIMFVLLVVYIVMGVRSFVAARRS